MQSREYSSPSHSVQLGSSLTVLHLTNDVDSGGDGSTVRLEDGVISASDSMLSLSLPSSVRSLKHQGQSSQAPNLDVFIVSPGSGVVDVLVKDLIMS